MRDMTLIPYVGVGTVQFGMTLGEVKNIWGKPDSTGTSGRGEIEEHRGDITVRYNTKTNCIIEISFGPESGLMFKGKSLYSCRDLIKFLLSKDSSPVECLGFLLFLNLGIAITGYHDEDDEQKSISVFKRGRWDSMKDNFMTFP